MKYIALACAVLLSGCGTTTPPPTPQIVIKTEYVVRTAPAALKKLPQYPSAVDVEELNGLDVASWIIASEKYILELEAQIGVLINFYEQPVDIEVDK